MTGYNRRTCSRETCSDPVVGRMLCGKHYQAAWKAGEFVNAPLPSRERARTVCPPTHKHDGSSTCYIQHQCRCIPCSDLHSRMERNRQKQKAYGRFDTGLVDAEPVREHLIMLGEFGLGYKRVASLAGIGITPVRNVIWGRQEPGPRYGELPKRIKRENAAAILAVRPDLTNLASGVKIPSRGAQRRIQALMTRGWSMSKIGRRIGVDPGNMSALLTGTQVTVARHLAIAALYDELWAAEPPRSDHRNAIAYARSKKYAAQRRWLPPLAWDDIDTDVEPPVPEDEEGIDETAVVLAMGGERVRLSPAERREAVTRLVASKLNDHAIADRLHMNVRSSLRIRQELGLAAPIGADRQVVA